MFYEARNTVLFSIKMFYFILFMLHLPNMFKRYAIDSAEPKISR